MRIKHRPTRNLVTDWRLGDAEHLARLSNESGPGWPGGSEEGQQTAEQAERWLKEHDRLAAFVAEAEGRIVAYCDLVPEAHDKRRAYIGLLNAHPSYHGRGFGKAVLLSCVEKAIELGFDCVDLGTWAGNLKAVPLYKKSGFMWAPETSVHMENFVPFALRHPLAQPFFSKHNWYETQVRDLALREDAYMHGKVRAFEYLWRADDEMLRMVFDRQSKGLLEIETDEVRCGCYLPEEKIVADLPHEIRWEVESKQGRPLDVTVLCRPDPGIACEMRESFTVRGREVRSARFTVDPDIPDKEREPFAHVIGSTVLLGGRPVELAAGMEVRQAATTFRELSFANLRPGRAERLTIEVTSHLDQPCRARVSAYCAHGAQMKRQSLTVDLPARGRARFPVSLVPDGADQIDIKAQATLTTRGRSAARGRTVRSKETRIPAHALPPGGLAGWADEHNACLENESISVMAGTGGWVRIHDRTGDRRANRTHAVMTMPAPGLGPPFAWGEFFTRPRLDAAIERRPDAVIAVLRSESERTPGLLLERRIILTHRPVIEIRDTVTNATGAARDLTLLRRGWMNLPGALVAVPTATGVIESPENAGLALWNLRIPEDPAQWPEGWACAFLPGFAIGLMWSEAALIEGLGHGLQQKLGRLLPGERAQAPPYYVFAGPGNAETVRSWWEALCGPTTRAPGRCGEPGPVVDFGLTPSPAILLGATQGWARLHPSASSGQALKSRNPARSGDRALIGLRARAFVRSFGERKLSGRLRLVMPRGLRADVAQIPFKGLDGRHPFSAPVHLQRTTARPGMHVGRAELQTEEVTYTRELPVIVVRGAAVEESREGAVLCLRAEPIALRVDPSFAGCAVSLQWEGREMLHSSYPQAGPFMWWNPWFGGITPHLDGLRDLLAREKFAARFVARRGASGSPADAFVRRSGTSAPAKAEGGQAWRGIAVTCSPKHERARHVRLSLEYLLLPGAPVAAVVVSRGNRSGATTQIGAGASIWLSLGGKPTDPVVVRVAKEPETVRHRTPERARAAFDPWGIIENRRAGCAVLLACGATKAPGKANASAELTGRDGYHLSTGAHGVVEPGETARAVFYLAFGGSAQQVEPYRHLARCADLP